MEIFIKLEWLLVGCLISPLQLVTGKLLVKNISLAINRLTPQSNKVIEYNGN
jgi:hypothetical protein